MQKKQTSPHESIFFRFIPPAFRDLCQRLAVGLAVLAAVYTLAGFLLAPYLLKRFLPQYAAEQLHARLTMDALRINPLLFRCEIKGLRLEQEGEDEPVLAVERLFVDFETDSLFRRAWTFADLVIEKPTIRLKIDSDGRLNLARLNPSGSAEAEEANPAPAEPQPLPRLYLQHFSLSGGSASLTDQSKKSNSQPFAIDPLNIELVKISTLPEQRGAYAVSAALPEGGTLGWKGDLSLAPILATGALELKNFKPATIWRFLPERVHIAPPPGTLALTAGYRFALPDGKPALEMNPVTISLEGLAVKAMNAAQPIVKLDTLTASDGRIDLAKHQVLFPSLALRGLTATANIDTNGHGNWEGLVEPDENEEPTPPWQIGIDSVTIADSTVGFNNASPANPITLNLELAKLSLANATIDLAKHKASGKHLAISGGGLALNLGLAAPAKPLKTPAKGHEQPGQESPWKTSLDQLEINGFSFGVTDQATKIAYTLRDLTAKTKNIGHPTQPITFDLKTGIEQGGEAALSGTVSQNGDRIEAQAHLARVSLKPLDALVDRDAAVALVSGNLSADMHLLRTQVEQQQGALTLDGDASINDLLLKEDDTGDRLLAWKEATVSGFALSLNPDRLTIREVRMLEPGTKIIIFKDKSLNLAKLRKQNTPQQPKPAEPSVKENQKPFPVAVDRVRLENGVVDFADFSLVLPFATRIHQCKGSANSISSEPASRTALKFDGRVGEFGQAKASGSLMPFEPKRFTDITVLFRNVAMAPLSPYTATFAGRAIASGKLNLDLEYKIKDSELAGKNSVVMEDFTLGDRVESPNAMSLPLDLAIALLTDSQGKIDLAVPINGNVDHPEFSYGNVVRQAISNLLSKVVTAPFRALASLFGGGAKNPDAVLFEPGQASLTPPEQEKLKEVSGVLDKKKQLLLTVHGGFDPALDGTALKTAHIRQALAQKLGEKIKADEEPAPVAFDNGKTQRALESLAGDEGLKTALTEYEKATGKKAKRVNPALALIGKGSEDREFYQALFAYLIKTAPLPQPELERLADKRGKAIVQELTGRAGANTDRVSLGPAVQSEEEDGAVPAKLELGLR
ncbi:MAG: DUF748 domain-containing protein [Deltaproteobacteria bacterium]|nr:DUF748 domain-containing protein [Deltaproteobacteria bacterium]